MNSKEHIKGWLNELRNVFPDLSFQYKFNHHSSTHIIDVRPVECYTSNPEYIKQEAEFSYVFDNLYYPESILFISEGSLTEITEPDFVFNTNQFSEDLQVPPPIAEINQADYESSYPITTSNFALAA